MDGIAVGILSALYAGELVDDAQPADLSKERVRQLLIDEAELELLQPVLEAFAEWRDMIGDYRPASHRVLDLLMAYDDYCEALRFARGKDVDTSA